MHTQVPGLVTIIQTHHSVLRQFAQPARTRVRSVPVSLFPRIGALWYDLSVAIVGRYIIRLTDQESTSLTCCDPRTKTAVFAGSLKRHNASSLTVSCGLSPVQGLIGGIQRHNCLTPCSGEGGRRCRTAVRGLAFSSSPKCTSVTLRLCYVGETITRRYSCPR